MPVLITVVTMGGLGAAIFGTLNRELPRGSAAFEHLSRATEWMMAQAFSDLGLTAAMVTAIMCSLVYACSALGNESRDRSILFWKSMPVPDPVGVLSKVAVPLVILPASVVVAGLLAMVCGC